MDWTDVGEALAGVAPGLANALLPGIGGPAVALIEKALGVAPGVFAGNPAAAAQAIQAATPEQIVALQHAQNELPLATMANEMDALEAQLADVQSARARDVALAQAGRKNSRPTVMLIGAYLSVIVVAALLATGKVDAATAVGGFLIAVGTMFVNKIATAFDYEYGSSRGSEAKTALMAAQLPLSPSLPPLPPGAKVIDGMPWLAK